MRRALLAATTLAVFSLSAAPTATACGIAFVDRLPGPTDAQRVDRGKRMHQDDLRAQADSVFLAQVSATRMVGRGDADYTLTPFFPLYDTPQPERSVTLRDSPLTIDCEVKPELGRVYAVYAERAADGWRVIELVRHADFQDRPPGMPTAREVARGMYDLPAYPE